MSVQEIANDLVSMCREGKFRESGDKYWADDVVSYEPAPPGTEMAEVRGIEGVRGKGDWWEANNEVHDVQVEGPYVNGDQFVVRFKMELTPKGGERTTMDEVGLYTIRNGKIAEERFFYAG